MLEPSYNPNDMIFKDYMKKQAILYVPSDTPEAMTMATRRVAGVPMIVRGLMTLDKAGISNVVLLVAKTQRATIEHFLTRFKKLPSYEIVEYDEPYVVSKSIVERVAKDTEDRILLINANLIFEPKLIETIKKTRCNEDEIKICTEGVHPIPIYEISSLSWKALGDFLSNRPKSLESCLRQLLEICEHKLVSKSADTNTFLLAHPRDRAVAEKSLAETIRLNIDGPVARHINKRISLPISLILSKLWISPNTITAVNIIIGVFSGVFVADGNRYEHILFGAILFQIASIVDGCDGEVAKLTFRCTKFGQYADTICDNLSLGSFLTGLIAGYWRHTHSFVAFTVGALLIFTTAITFFWMIRFLRNKTNSASLVTFDKEYLRNLKNQPKWLIFLIKYGKYTLKKDVFSFGFLCFAVFGILYWWLFMATLGTTVAAIILTYLHLQEYFKSVRCKDNTRNKIKEPGQTA